MIRGGSSDVRDDIEFLSEATASAGWLPRMPAVRLPRSFRSDDFPRPDELCALEAPVPVFDERFELQLLWMLPDISAGAGIVGTGNASWGDEFCEAAYPADSVLRAPGLGDTDCDFNDPSSPLTDSVGCERALYMVTAGEEKSESTAVVNSLSL